MKVLLVLFSALCGYFVAQRITGDGYFPVLGLLSGVLIGALAIVLEENVNVLTYYNDFAFADIDDSAFSATVNTIGPNWRNVKSPSPSSTNSVKTDRIYLVKDAEGSIFKVLFTKMLNEDGDRGYPGLKYQKLAE